MTDTVKTADPKNSGFRGALSKIFDIIGDIFKPILVAIIGAGILQALRDILLMTGAIDRVSSSYIFLDAMGSAVFYFLPILLAFSSARVFGATPFLAVAIAAFFVFPSVVNLFNWANNVGWNLTFFGVVPITYANYPSSVLPIIIIVWFQSKVEPIVKKIVPDLLKSIFVPVLTMFVTIFAGLVILGPIGTWIGDGLAFVINWLNEAVSWLVPTVIGAISPFLVLTGSHYSLFPIATQNLAQLGYDTVLIPGMMVSNLALAGVSFAVAFKAKNSAYKSYSASAGITSVFGISQSSLYGNAIPLKTPLVAAVLAGGIAGFYAGITSIRAGSFVTPGVLALFGFIEEESFANLINAIIANLIALVSGFVLTLVMKFEEPSATEVVEITGGSSPSEDKKTKQQKAKQVQDLVEATVELETDIEYETMLSELAHGASLLGKYAGIARKSEVESIAKQIADEASQRNGSVDTSDSEESDE